MPLLITGVVSLLEELAAVVAVVAAAAADALVDATTALTDEDRSLVLLLLWWWGEGDFALLVFGEELLRLLGVGELRLVTDAGLDGEDRDILPALDVEFS